jgi:hypothetical protein
MAQLGSMVAGLSQAQSAVASAQSRQDRALSAVRSLLHSLVLCLLCRSSCWFRECALKVWRYQLEEGLTANAGLIKGNIEALDARMAALAAKLTPLLSR